MSSFAKCLVMGIIFGGAAALLLPSMNDIDGILAVDSAAHGSEGHEHTGDCRHADVVNYQTMTTWTNEHSSENYQIGPEDHPGFQDPPPDYDTELEKALRVLVHVESGGNPNAVGDKGLKDKAYGVLQIRKPYLDDVNRIFGDQIQDRWGKSSLSMSEMKDPDKAHWVAETYLTHYGAAYARKTGREPTVTVYARIHNGGPTGWKKASTNDHARKVEQVIAQMDRGDL